MEGLAGGPEGGKAAARFNCPRDGRTDGPTGG